MKDTYAPKRAPPRCAAWSNIDHLNIIPATSRATTPTRA